MMTTSRSDLTIALVDPTLRYNSVVGTLIGVEARVAMDIAKRQELGIAKYGTTLSNNKVELIAKLKHAYEECLDQALYLKWAIEELEREQG